MVIIPSRDEAETINYRSATEVGLYGTSTWQSLVDDNSWVQIGREDSRNNNVTTAAVAKPRQRTPEDTVTDEGAAAHSDTDEREKTSFRKQARHLRPTQQPSEIRPFIDTASDCRACMLEEERTKEKEKKR